MTAKQVIVWMYHRLNGDKKAMLNELHEKKLKPTSEAVEKDLKEWGVNVDEWCTIVDDDYPFEMKLAWSVAPEMAELAFKRGA